MLVRAPALAGKSLYANVFSQPLEALLVPTHGYA